MKKKSFLDLHKDTLYELLKLCAETEVPDAEIHPDRQRCECLEDLLADPLPQATADKTAASAHLDSICDLSGMSVSICLRELLLNPETNIQILQRIRKHGKSFIRQGKTPLEQETGGIIYHAAIASALVFHDQGISKLSQQDMHKTFVALSKESWLPADIRKLFKGASKSLKP
jgi:hypothetical protein